MTRRIGGGERVAGCGGVRGSIDPALLASQLSAVVAERSGDRGVFRPNLRCHGPDHSTALSHDQFNFRVAHGGSVPDDKEANVRAEFQKRCERQSKKATMQSP
ncbi:hypothetical protein L1887_58156 [Cichorium endivia]|nr:hypothetical protein L1887_58156 [Cichorium endivia]